MKAIQSDDVYDEHHKPKQKQSWHYVRDDGTVLHVRATTKQKAKKAFRVHYSLSLLTDEIIHGKFKL